MVKLEVDKQVAWVTLDSPESDNSLTAQSVGELYEAVVQARNADVGVVVLSRSGSKNFSVGGDLAAFGSAPDAGSYIDDLAETLHRTVSEMQRMNAIVVSVVQGIAAGAAVSLAAAADLVIAAESAKFTLAYTKIGLTPDGGSSLLTETLGMHRALHMALLNPVVTAEEAREFGLVAEVHPSGELDEAVNAIVSKLSTGSRSALVAAKRLFRDQATPTPESAMRRGTLAIRSAAAGSDGREGIASFLEKRKPRFPSSELGLITK